MGHLTDAFIGKMPIDLDKLKYYQLAVAFENDYAIVFLDEDHLMQWHQKLKLNYLPDNNTTRFGGELIHHFANELGLIDYVIIQLDYSWNGAYYQDKLLIEEGDINQVLKSLGVKSTENINEFDLLNLNEYRLSEAFYWDIDTPYVQKENIIKGSRKI